MNDLIQLARTLNRPRWAAYLEARAKACPESAQRQGKMARQIAKAMRVKSLDELKPDRRGQRSRTHPTSRRARAREARKVQKRELAAELVQEAVRAEDAWERAPDDPPRFKGAPPAVMEKRGMTPVMRDQSSGESQ